MADQETQSLEKGGGSEFRKKDRNNHMLARIPRKEMNSRRRRSRVWKNGGGGGNQSIEKGIATSRIQTMLARVPRKGWGTPAAQETQSMEWK
jgi:hypothetical protein